MLRKTLVVLFVVTLFFEAATTPLINTNVSAEENKKGNNDSLNNGLVAYWSFNEGKGNTLHDYSTNNNDGTLHGPKWVQGIHNYSLEFDGINDYVTVPDDPSLNFHNTNKFSISLWIKREGVLITHDEALVSKGTHAYKKGYGVNIKRKNNTIEFYVKGGGKEFTCYSSIDLYDNLWYYVTAVWDGYAQRIYINGELNNFKNLSDFTIDDDHKALEIGNHYHAANYHPFHGLIDEIRIYNRVLSEGEIRFLYNHPGGGSPPSADFKVNKTGDSRIIEFNAVGSNLTGCLLKWDLNGDGKWDATGDFDEMKTVLYEYPKSGIYNATLYVENPVGNNSCTKKFAVLTNHSIKWSNHGFFLSYPTTPLTAPLKNKYVFTCSPNILDHVMFKLGEHNYTDNTPSSKDGKDVWEAVINMNEGKHGDKLQILGYDKENDLVWKDEVDTFILITPPWFNAFLLLSDITVYNSENYSYWNITIVPPNIGLGYKMDKVPVKYIGGKYGVNATVTGPQNFTIESTETLTVYYPLCSLDIPLFSKENKTKKPVNLGSYKKAKWNINVDFAATADVQINPKEVALAGCLTLQGDAGVSFDVPVAGIPFLAEAGLSGGVDAEFGTKFVVTRFGEDGLTFCPEGFSKVFFGLNGHAGLYAQVLWGLGRLEGGLYADGELSMSLPSLEKQMHLYGGVYAKACCWKWCNEWSCGIEFDSTSNTLEWRKVTETKTRESENMDLLCLKDSWSEKTRGKTFNDPLNVLAYNVVGNAYPKIVLTDNNTGLAVWTDINKVDNNSFQSDIWWSEYSPDTGWSAPKSTNTTNKCEYNPTLTLITDRNGEQKVVITYLTVDSVVNVNSSIKNFYKNNSINTATWSIEKGCSFSGGNITALNGTINSKQACYAGNNTIYMVYLFDTNPSPWENGNGNITIVKGLINNSKVDWKQTKVLKTLKTFNFTCDPSISFLTPNVGGITYTWFNNGLNETTLLATTSGLNNFTELTIRKTNLTVEHATCSAFNNSLMVSWIENHSSILACKVTLDELKEWVIKNVTTVYNGLSVSYIKPVYSDNKTYYLFQVGEKFIPFIIELLNNGSWGKIRQISLNETYSVGQLDGDNNPSMSQMIYIRDTPVEKWEVGHWEFNEGNSNVTVDSSNKNNNGYITGLPNNATYWFKNNGGNNNLTEEYGYGLGFKNKTGYVYIPHNNSLNTSHEFTVTGWIRVFNHSNNASLLGKNGSWLLFEHNGFLSLKLWEKNHSIIIKDIAALPLNTWVFTTVVYDRGIVKVSVSPMSYKNVSKKYILNDTSVNTSVSPLIIGGFNGTVDEIRLFNRAVTNEIIDRIWFAPHATLGGIHDVVVQQLPSFASLEINVNGLKNLDENVKITTQDNVEFTGIPCNFSFNWDFGDGTTVTGNPVYHRFKKPGFYHITMKATNPETGAVTPFTKTLHVWDTTPPLFNGLEHAQNGNCYVKLNWSAASDDSPFVLYYVYMSKNRSFNYNQPVLITSKTRCNITNLKPGETYYFTVKAKDSAGNIDNNTVVKTATPFDRKPPVFNGIKKALNISNSPSKILLSWEKAKDCSPVVYNIYVSTTPSGHNLSKPYETTTNTWYPFKCSQNRRYYFIVKAEDTWGNKENNTIEKNATPVWENTPPEINNIKAEPTLQEAGETVNITCNVTDNYIVENVHVNITCPDGVIQNLSITQNKKNDIYHLNKTYNIVGVYNYFIWTVDECNNSNQSNTYSFIIQDNTPPTITNVIDYPDPQKEKGYVNITCNVSDNSQVNTVKVNITYPDGSWVNTTMLGSYYYNTTYNIAGIYHYFIWANDSSNNVNTSSIYSFEIKPLDTTPPVTTKKVGYPKYGTNNEYVTSHTYFNLTATDDKSGVNKTLYRIWWKNGWTTWITYNGNFTLTGENKHYLEFYSIDNAGNIEKTHNQTHYVDDTPPTTAIEYDEPYYVKNKTVWVTRNTTIHFKTDDQPMYASGVNSTWYKVDDGTWKTYDKPFTVPEECKHTIYYYSVDHLRNTEKTRNQTLYVDNTPPKTTLKIEGPYLGNPFTSKPFFVTTHTHFLLYSKDNQSECNVGTRNIYYRIWNIYSGWSNWMIYQNGPFSTPGFTLKEECLHYIEYYSDDYLGNKETVHNISCYVDNTPPTTIGYGYYPIHLIAHDPGKGGCPAVGGYHVHYRHKVGDNGEWSQWFVGGLNEDITLWLPEQGVSPIGQPIYVDYYAVDILGNKEEIHHDVFTSETKNYYRN